MRRITHIKDCYLLACSIYIRHLYILTYIHFLKKILFYVILYTEVLSKEVSIFPPEQETSCALQPEQDLREPAAEQTKHLRDFSHETHKTARKFQSC